MWRDDLNVVFRLNSEFIISNSSKTLSSLEIDFGKGSGYQSIQLNTNVKIKYSSFGEKWLRIKLTYTDNSVYYSTSRFKLEVTKDSKPKFLNGFAEDPVLIPHPTIANHGVNLYVEYGCRNGNEIRKPFIYVEGFNPNRLTYVNYSPPPL